MKRFVCLLLVFIMALCLAACGTTDAPAAPEVTNTPLPIPTAEPTLMPAPAPTPDPTPPANTFTVGNLLVAYPNGAEVKGGDGSFTLLLAGEDVAMYFETAETSFAYSAREAIEKGDMNGMVQKSLEEQAYAVQLIEAPQVIPLLDTKAVYSFYEAAANDVTKFARFYLFSDGMYDYTITSAIQEQYQEEYDPWVEQIIERLSWIKPPLPLGWKFYEDELFSFEYPARYMEWSKRTMTNNAVLETLTKLVPENSGYWVEDLETFHIGLYDREGAGASIVPRINVKLQDVPEATEETLQDPAVLQAITDQINAQYPNVIWHRDIGLEQHGERTFAVMIAEAMDGKRMLLYQAMYVWEEKMVVFVLGTTPEQFDNHVIAEMEALLASMRIK